MHEYCEDKPVDFGTSLDDFIRPLQLTGKGSENK